MASQCITAPLYSGTSAAPRTWPRKQAAVLVGLTNEERIAIKLCAAACGLPVSTYLRSLAIQDSRRLGIDWPAQQKAPRRTTEST